jgi:hypothetical protein
VVVAAPLSTVSRQAEALSLCLQEHPSDVFDVSQHAGSTWEVADPKSGGTLLTEWGREGDHFDPISQVRSAC